MPVIAWLQRMNRKNNFRTYIFRAKGVIVPYPGIILPGSTCQILTLMTSSPRPSLHKASYISFPAISFHRNTKVILLSGRPLCFSESRPLKEFHYVL